MIEELQKDPSKLRLGGDRKELTFMFMDICGFTPISEHYMKQDDPEGLVELINKFLDMQTKIILNNGGTIDKYMGEYIKDRAIKRGHTTTTVVKRGDNWKVTITYSK